MEETNDQSLVEAEQKLEPGVVGYMVPGVVLMSVGLWWTLNVFWLHSKTYYRQQYYQSRQAFTCQICATRRCNPTAHSVEGYIKISLAFFGVVYEMMTAFEDGQLVSVSNVQLATVYMVFGLAGLLDVINSRCCGAARCLPRFTDYTLMCLAFLLEGVTLHSHHYISGYTHYFTYEYIHLLLMYVTFACAISFAAEAIRNDVVLIALLRCFCVTLHGTWLVTAGLLVYSDYLVESDDSLDAFAWTGVYFAWNMLCVILLFLALALVIHWCNFSSNSNTNLAPREHHVLIANHSEQVSLAACEATTAMSNEAPQAPSALHEQSTAHVI